MAVQVQLLLFGVVIMTTIVTKTTVSQPSMPEGCSDSCGALRIPYPFGTTPGCYYSPSFHLTCNHTFDPPKPFFHGSNVSILNISLERGELRVETVVARDCYNKAGNLLAEESYPYSYTRTHTKFPLSQRNKFTGVGCDTVGLIGGNGARYYATGCVALCNQTHDIVNGSCSGIGCCQMGIPQGITHYLTIAQSLTKNHSAVHDFNPCGFAFVAEQDAYNFSALDLRNLQNREKFPVVLDWALGYLTCEEAKRNLTGYACRARNSVCLNSNNGAGYRCKCLQGFEGNPYLLDGCKDINECERSNPCSIKCENLPGSFSCSSCPKGFKGDGLRDGTGCSPVDKRNNGGYIKRLSIALGICTGLLILLLASSWIYWGVKKRRHIELKEKFFQQNGGVLLQRQLLSHQRGSTETAKIFTAEELKRATNNFDQTRVIGQGGYGTVYKGVLANNNKVVAIKKSKIGDQSQIEPFINEVIVLSQINHRNVVKLLGCCLETEVPLLVYEFITNGTLSDHIHNKVGSLFPWEKRLKIATETAGAIAYLHSSTSMPIIHRDIKTANILLDKNHTAKVSDFGASRLVPLDQTQLTTLVQGTLGYLDPEYFHTSQLTEKSDVYSFGVVLAELLTGQRALSFARPEGERNLALYFISSIKEDQLREILDDNLAIRENIQAIKAVASLAEGCLRVRGKERPTMKEVASELEGMMHKKMHPWNRAEDDLTQEETENLLKSSDVRKYYDHGGCCSNSTARFESMNNEMLQSYKYGR
ncbi:Wall-associated receptor kinase [Trema orientale]|uniref:Wall-associated receptor kinase n=1 Tax=Trema orientale TaxID=63057 RepID=A0A2P5FW02_TREOI|nr:Wall-associated receptor kinase [Trema orientale]